MNFIASRVARVSTQALQTQTRGMAAIRGNYNHLPFKHQTMRQFNTRYIPFMLVGASIPFGACWYKIRQG